MSYARTAGCGRTVLIARLLLLPALLSPACAPDSNPKEPPPPRNEPPVITKIDYVGDRILTRQRIVVYAAARDPNFDNMGYKWSASRGYFPDGSQWSTVAWFTDDLPGLDTLRVRVWDYADTSRLDQTYQVRTVEPPDSLTGAAGSSIIDLRWKPSFDDGVAWWKGYEVYRAERSFDGIPADSLDAYRLPGFVTESSFRVANLTRGQRYWFRVGAVRGWEDHLERSPLTAQFDHAPRPEFTREIGELWQAGGGDGLDLSSGWVRALDPDDASGLPLVDAYLGTADPLDGAGGGEEPAPLRLKSVSALANRNPAWAARGVGLKRLGTNWDVGPIADDGWGESVDVVEGAVYALKTPEGNFAKLLVIEVHGLVHPYRRVTIRWAYQLLADYPKV